ncbi:hypothetical protein RRG08_038791 [Elysia crispata]|uniref:Uncharacterized protein n=1 Tax=Elysia crispata TaxID=231223 RepID=A0AAE0YV38_9GAST|nr:hypothetical protein RRG08_038791 [Elysia crispata]
MTSLVSSYPTGAPIGACTNLNPDSHGPSTAKGPSPYKITFSSSTYQPGQVIQVQGIPHRWPQRWRYNNDQHWFFPKS